jgi:hypothetical protein
LTDGSLRLYTDKIAGEKAIISEVWLYEKGTTKPLNPITERGKELAQLAPQGSILKAFCDFSSINDVKKRIQYGRTDFLPISPIGMKRRNIGYFNDTQNRNTVETPLIKEEEITSTFDKTETYDWSNILCLENNTQGVMLVKESHKCVNQYGAETGDFELTKTGIANRGTALLPQEITPDTYKWCWATWSILYKAGDVNQQLALKEFDRIRYPIDPSRDIYIQANTWGSGRDRAAAVETNVLKEINQQAALGIDIQQVDDGWQDNKT